MTEISHPKINLLLLTSSLVLGIGAVAICGLTRMFLMNSSAEWLAFDYTTLGWILRIIAALIGCCSLVLALLARKGAQKRAVRKFYYRTDVALALFAIAYEVAIPLILFIVVVELASNAFLKSVEAPSLGCFAGGLDFFDLFDSGD